MKRRIGQSLLIITLVSVVPVIFFNIYYRIFEPEACAKYLIGYTVVEKTLVDITFSFLATFSIFTSTSFIMRLFARKMPWKTTKVGQRIVFEFLSISTVAGVLMAIICYFYWPFLSMTVLDDFNQIMFKNISTAIIITTIWITVSEGVSLFQDWRASELQAERLVKENVQSQFEALKNQINPHFLFNSLNALSSLVHSDPDKAEEFIDEFANIYRYVLDVKDKNVVSLDAELHFLDSFMFLQQIRFGDHLRLEKTIPDSKLNQFLPSLALQELIENAIKHNEVSGKRPLTIKVFVENDMLVVSNQLQLRKEEIESTGIGLNNLRKRYELFGDKEPKFGPENSCFVARLPLIEAE